MGWGVEIRLVGVAGPLSREQMVGMEEPEELPLLEQVVALEPLAQRPYL